MSAELMPREELEQLQLERLQITLNRAYRNVHFYNRKMKEMGIDPSRIKSLEDLKYLPIMDRRDVVENYPFGLFAEPMKDVVRVDSLPGVGQMPIAVGYTSNDVRNWNEMTARLLSAGGLDEHHIVQICLDHGLNSLGRWMQDGTLLLGAACIPSSGVNDINRLMVMKDYRVTTLITSPSYALHLAQIMRELGLQANTFSLKVCFALGETLLEEERRKIAETFGIDVMQGFGVHDIFGSIFAYECRDRKGLHLCEDHILAEIIDPFTGENLPPGREGELVITTLTSQAYPVIRLRTGVATAVLEDSCSCGRTSRRIAPIKRRVDDSVFVRGTRINLDVIETALKESGRFLPDFIMVIDRADHLDTAELWVEMDTGYFSDSMRKTVETIQQLEREIEELILIPIRLKLVSAKTVADMKRRGSKIIDKRDKTATEVDL